MICDKWWSFFSVVVGWVVYVRYVRIHISKRKRILLKIQCPLSVKIESKTHITLVWGFFLNSDRNRKLKTPKHEKKNSTLKIATVNALGCRLRTTIRSICEWKKNAFDEHWGPPEGAHSTHFANVLISPVIRFNCFRYPDCPAGWVTFAYFSWSNTIPQHPLDTFIIENHPCFIHLFISLLFRCFWYRLNAHCKHFRSKNVVLPELNWTLTSRFDVFVDVVIFDGHISAAKHHWVENFRP